LEPTPEPDRPNFYERTKIFILNLIQPQTLGLPMAAGLRGRQEGVYQVGEIQVVVEIDVDTDNPTQKVLSAVVTGIDTVGMKASLWRSGVPKAAGSVVLDDFGHFIITGLEPGTYELIIQGDEPPIEIYLQTLQV
jgi:hypothetical protein